MSLWPGTAISMRTTGGMVPAEFWLRWSTRTRQPVMWPKMRSSRAMWSRIAASAAADEFDVMEGDIERNLHDHAPLP